MKDKQPIRFLIFVAVAVILSVTASRKSIKPEPPGPQGVSCPRCNLIIISLSNLQKKHMGIYGYQKLTTPKIDHFFDHSVILQNAISPASLTYTDSLSFFYSLFPYTHKMMGRQDIGLSEPVLEKNRSLPEVLAAAGYETAAFVSDEDYAYENGLGDVFDTYFDRAQYPRYNILFKPWQYNVGTKDLLTPATDWLTDHASKPFFMFFQAYDMHCPYTPNALYKHRFAPHFHGQFDNGDCFMTLKPIEKKVRHGQNHWLMGSWHSMLKNQTKSIEMTDRDIQDLIGLYDGELAQADSNLGQLFETLEDLDLLDRSVIVFMSEHGDYLGENGYFMKAALTADGNLHNANLSFPFLVRLPGLKKRLNYSPPIELTDLAPTLLDLLQVDPGSHTRDGMQGTSLAPLLESGKAAHEYVFSGSIREREGKKYRVEAIQNLEWKLTLGEPVGEHPALPDREVKLIHLSVDPNENTNVAEKNPTLVEDMMKVLLLRRSQLSAAEVH